jgi:hypothetical protein
MHWCELDWTHGTVAHGGVERGRSGDSGGWRWMGFDFHYVDYGRGSGTGERRR